MQGILHYLLKKPSLCEKEDLYTLACYIYWNYILMTTDAYGKGGASRMLN